MKGTIGNGLDSIIAQAIEEMKAEQGTSFHLEHLNLAELERRTGISRARLRRLQKSEFVSQPHGRIGHKAAATDYNHTKVGYSVYHLGLPDEKHYPHEFPDAHTYNDEYKCTKCGHICTHSSTVVDDEERICCDACGLIYVGWYTSGNNWYYYDENGIVRSSWRQVDGKWYYFNDNGTMATGWAKHGTSWYYMSDDVMETG